MTGSSRLRIAERGKTRRAAAAAALLLAALAARADVVLPEKAPEPLRFGAREVEAALKAKGGAAPRVVIAERGDALLGRIRRAPVPDAAESYAISVDGNTVAVEGRDAAGAMYGALDLAEQISWAEGDVARALKPRAKSPFLPVRGVNAFLTAQGLDDPGSWFWSDDFWRSYLDQLVRTRHNFLDLHGPFDLTVSWPNGFSYFVWLPEFPEVGVGRERAARNMARFRDIIRMAAGRGVKVGFMNYKAEAPIGPWKPGDLERDVLFWRHRPPQAAGFLAAEKLERYTREAAAAFLKGLPELWMFGFRVGESGQAPDFYRKTYLEALKSVPESLNVYTRTWQVDPAEVRALAASMKNRFYIEPKYNGEHLGLPYHAALGGRKYSPSGSYEDYTNYPRRYEIIWQIRAHGTNRVFHWGWPEFARRTARSCKFGGGIGFSMEPLNAYMPETDFLHRNPAIDHRFTDWKHQQDWFWYLVWGRTAYDPDVPDRVWTEEFSRRFGRGAGPLVYRAVAASSRVVPFVFSYHHQGLDHQSMAPEFETGDYPFKFPAAVWKNGRLVPHPPSIRNFLETGVLDRTAMADPVSYAEQHLGGKASGRMTPFEAGEYLGDAADESERLIREAAALAPQSAKEFDCIRMDVDAVAALARYYRDRILSATHLAFYGRTRHHPELAEARRLMQQAVAHWGRLADVAEGHYGQVPEPIRMRTARFSWKEEGKRLATVVAEIDRMQAEFRSTAPEYGKVGHVPPRKARPGKAISIVATARTDRPLHLFYKQPGALGFTEAPLKIRDRAANTWEGEIPPGAALPGTLEYYFETHGIPERWGYGGTLEDRGPYAVRVTGDDSRPAILHHPPRAARGASIRIEARVTDNARIESVSVYYKRMPACYEWVKVAMRRNANGVYGADLPLTGEGILYWFEAVDENGNAANHPHFLERTPYYAVEGWEAK